MDSTATNTMTTPAMPTTATADDPRRWGMVFRLSQLTANTCVRNDMFERPRFRFPFSVLRFVCPLRFPERVSDPDPHRPRRRQQPGCQADTGDHRDAEQHVALRQDERR